MIRRHWPAPRYPIAVATHHKVGTTLMASVFGSMASTLGWTARHVAGHRPAPVPPPDVLLLQHGTPAGLPDDPDLRVIHLVRDPREVLVSGYLHHQHSDEAWCTLAPPTTPPMSISFPLVPHSQEDRDREWKIAYLRSLDGRSYRDNLCARNRTEGLLFELDHYARWTIEEMATWTGSTDARVLTVRFEDLLSSFDETFAAIGRHLGLRTPERLLLARAARREDIGRKSEDELRSMTHVHGPTPGRWEQFVTGVVAERLDEICDRAADATPGTRLD